VNKIKTKWRTGFFDWIAVYITLFTMGYPIVVLVDFEGSKYLSNRRYNIKQNIYYAFIYSTHKIGKCILYEDGSAPDFDEARELEKELGEDDVASYIDSWYYTDPELEMTRKLYND